MMRQTLLDLEQSKIRQVANAGIGRTDVLPFWFGEGHEVTPAFIRDAAQASLAAGETFYSHNLGLAPLREAIAQHASQGRQVIEPDRVAVTSAGVNALSLIAQALCDPGDKVVIVTPVWPNLTQIPRILGAHVHPVALRCVQGQWQLDLQRLLDAITPDTRMVLVNSPNNPTGWTMLAHDVQALVEHCRKLGVWLVSDDAYELLYYADGARAPSALDHAHAQDRIISANTFSKPFAMTGFRLGWLVAPVDLMQQLGKLIEYNTSCAPVFVQRAGLAALTHAQGAVTAQRMRQTYQSNRDMLVQALSALPGVQVMAPTGAMYVFFKLPSQLRGAADDLQCCIDLVQQAGLGLAPGSAFGPEGAGYVRWCYAADQAKLQQGVARFSAFVQINAV